MIGGKRQIGQILGNTGERSWRAISRTSCNYRAAFQAQAQQRANCSLTAHSVLALARDCTRIGHENGDDETFFIWGYSLMEKKCMKSEINVLIENWFELYLNY